MTKRLIDLTRSQHALAGRLFERVDDLHYELARLVGPALGAKYFDDVWKRRKLGPARVRLDYRWESDFPKERGPYFGRTEIVIECEVCGKVVGSRDSVHAGWVAWYQDPADRIVKAFFVTCQGRCADRKERDVGSVWNMYDHHLGAFTGLGALQSFAELATNFVWSKAAFERCARFFRLAQLLPTDADSRGMVVALEPDESRRDSPRRAYEAPAIIREEQLRVEDDPTKEDPSCST